jgi:hypothetical protein
MGLHNRLLACVFLACLAASAFALTGVSMAVAQDCPTAKSAASGYVIERETGSKTEVLFGDASVVRTIMRFDGKILLETTQFQGMFDLERIDRGRRAVFRPKSDLSAVFPLTVGKTATVEFDVEGDGQPPTSAIRVSVKAADTLYIGRCKYNVLKIERSESRGGGPFAMRGTDYYSPDLKLVIAREYREGAANANLIKFDRISTIKP